MAAALKATTKAAIEPPKPDSILTTTAVVIIIIISIAAAAAPTLLCIGNSGSVGVICGIGVSRECCEEREEREDREEGLPMGDTRKEKTRISLEIALGWGG